MQIIEHVTHWALRQKIEWETAHLGYQTIEHAIDWVTWDATAQASAQATDRVIAQATKNREQAQ